MEGVIKCYELTSPFSSIPLKVGKEVFLGDNKQCALPNPKGHLSPAHVSAELNESGKLVVKNWSTPIYTIKDNKSSQLSPCGTTVLEEGDVINLCVLNMKEGYSFRFQVRERSVEELEQMKVKWENKLQSLSQARQTEATGKRSRTHLKESTDDHHEQPSEDEPSTKRVKAEDESYWFFVLLRLHNKKQSFPPHLQWRTTGLVKSKGLLTASSFELAPTLKIYYYHGPTDVLTHAPEVGSDKWLRIFTCWTRLEKDVDHTIFFSLGKDDITLDEWIQLGLWLDQLEVAWEIKRQVIQSLSQIAKESTDMASKSPCDIVSQLLQSSWTDSKVPFCLVCELLGDFQTSPMILRDLPPAQFQKLSEYATEGMALASTPLERSGAEHV